MSRSESLETELSVPLNTAMDGASAPVQVGEILQWMGGGVWVTVPPKALSVEMMMDAQASVLTEVEKRITSWLGWDEDRGLPWESDNDAAERLVEELGERGYRAVPDGNLVILKQGKAVVARGNGRHLREALVKAVLKLAA